MSPTSTPTRTPAHIPTGSPTLVVEGEEIGLFSKILLALLTLLSHLFGFL